MNSSKFLIYVQADGVWVMVDSRQAESAPKPQFPPLWHLLRAPVMPNAPVLLISQLYSKENADVALTQLLKHTAVPLLVTLLV